MPGEAEDPRTPDPGPVSPGAAVITRDGATIGAVRDVEAEWFRVAVTRGRDYWLSSEFVLRATSEAVELDFDAERLDDYKMTQPGPGANESPALNEEAETFGSEDEQTRRRQAMEHGYGPHEGDQNGRVH